MSVAKLSRPGDPDKPRIVPKGWGAPRAEPAQVNGAAPAQVDDVAAQRERIAAKLTGGQVTDQNSALREQAETEGPSMADRARAAFSQTVQAALSGDGTYRPENGAGAPIQLPDNGLTRAVNAEIAKADAAGSPQPTVLVGKTEITRPTTRTRTKAAAPEPVTAPWDGVTPELRFEVFKFVADKCESPQEAIELAREIVEFLSGE